MFLSRNKFLSKFNDCLISLRKRKIMTSQSVYEAIESLKVNPYYEKYSKKISQLEKSSPEELISRWQKLKENTPGKIQVTQSDQESLTDNKKSEIVKCRSKNKILNDVMKLDLIMDKTPDHIKEIWEAYHKVKERTLSAVIPSATYNLQAKKSKQYPMFILPLPRQQGYEFFVMQFHENEVHFTSLVNYQTHKENSPECLALIYYTELLNDKGIVLMSGEYDDNILNAFEAQCLVNQIQLYYGNNDERKTRFLERFTNYPDDFNYVDLIAETESLQF